MSEPIESVKSVARLYRQAAELMSPEDDKREFHARTAERLEAAAVELVRLYGLTSALPPDLGNVFDLPPELLEELSIVKSDELEDQLVTVINAYGGTASLDQILVGLYRKFGIAQKRRFIQNKLYRMTMVWSVPGKKGIYMSTEPEELPQADPNGEVVIVEPIDDIIGGESEFVGEEKEDDEKMPF